MKAQDVCDKLNKLLENVDLYKLAKTQCVADCNETAEAGVFMFGRNQDGSLSIGLIGVLNGLIDDAVIAARFDDGKIAEFVVYRQK